MCSRPKTAASRLDTYVGGRDCAAEIGPKDSAKAQRMVCRSKACPLWEEHVNCSGRILDTNMALRVDGVHGSFYPTNAPRRGCVAGIWSHIYRVGLALLNSSCRGLIFILCEDASPRGEEVDCTT